MRLGEVIEHDSTLTVVNNRDASLINKIQVYAIFPKRHTSIEKYCTPSQKGQVVGRHDAIYGKDYFY